MFLKDDFEELRNLIPQSGLRIHLKKAINALLVQHQKKVQLVLEAMCLHL